MSIRKSLHSPTNLLKSNVFTLHFPLLPRHKRISNAKKLIEIASEIVQTQVSLTSMTATDIASSLREVFSTLNELQKAETSGIVIEFTQPAAEEAAASKLSPADSIQNEL
jgi:predicted transcriptional regulator